MTSEVPHGFTPDPLRRIGVSFRASYARRVESGFMAAYFGKPAILDIGFRGEDAEAVPITQSAIGVDLDYPGYDGKTLPFADESQDTVLAAHVLEHIVDYAGALRDWLRVLKVGGFLVLILPHRDLYERKPDLPSRWNGDHKRFYTPASLLAEVETALPVNSIRVRHLCDNDYGFDYARTPGQPPFGGFEIELVLEKIARPAWADALRASPDEEREPRRLDALAVEAVRAVLRNEPAHPPSPVYFPPWGRLLAAFATVEQTTLEAAVRTLLEALRIDEPAYLAAYEDLARAHAEGALSDANRHWREHGYFEGRVGALAPAKTTRES